MAKQMESLSTASTTGLRMGSSRKKIPLSEECGKIKGISCGNVHKARDHAWHVWLPANCSYFCEFGCKLEIFFPESRQGKQLTTTSLRVPPSGFFHRPLTQHPSVSESA